MKFIKWKSLIITCIVCLLPIFLGLALWHRLPDEIAVHFNIYNEPDGFASKGVAVFGLPFMMAVLQAVCCFINDINAHKHGIRKKFERATKLIIPVMSIILQTVTFVYALGIGVDIRKVASLIVGFILLVVGNYLPKFDYVKNYDVSTQKARKINRFIGYETTVMGILFVISIFLPPVATLCCLALLIPYALIAVIYGIKNGRN